MNVGISTRYRVLGTICVGCLAASCCAAALAADQLDVWVGTVTPKNGLSKGIYHARLDPEKGKLTEPVLAAELDSPGFVALHPDGQVLYSTGTIDNQPSVVAFRIVRGEGRAALQLINSQPTGDGAAAHLATDRTGGVLLSAQYGGGSTASFSLEADGAIGPQAELVKHEGASNVDPGRQSKPHAHWAGVSPDNRFVFVPDLGMDKVVIYRLDAATAKLTPHGFGIVPPGAGPRHMKFHPNGQYIYVLNELALSVTVFAYDAQRGEMSALQTIPTVPEEDKAKEMFVSASEIRVHPSGKFVYAANRGHDTVSVFQVDETSGRLTRVEIEPIRGAWPRNFNLDPSGRWLLAAGQDSNTISVFAVDQDSGELTYGRAIVSVPTPICVLFGQ
jgi:6-phosphogluconolactonase